MPDKMSQEKILLLRAFGARVVVTPTAVEPDDPRSYYSVAHKLVEETPNAILANQYHNPVNPQAHYETTGPELWRQTKGRITHLVVGMGTGGTITGVGALSEGEKPAHQRSSASTRLAPFCTSCTAAANTPKPKGTRSKASAKISCPARLDLSVVDTWCRLTTSESFLMTRRLVREEGMFCGGSCGAAVAGAIKYAHDQRLGKDDVVVVMLPDSGSRYLSKVFDDEWMRENGFLEQTWVDFRAADIQAAKHAHDIIAARAHRPDHRRDCPDEAVQRVAAARFG
jgi:cystathionine beta-synthase